MTTRFISGRPLPVQVPTAFVRIRPARRSGAGLRRVAPRRAGVLCCSASAPAAVGSRSPRPSSPPSRCARPGIEIALVPITTAGDRDRTRPFGEIGARGVFVKELEEALLEGRIDVAVHSAKDMTSTDTDGLAVGAYLPREDPRDALCGAAGSARDADRHGFGAPPRAAARARADAFDRAAARQHRHAVAQARRARARRHRARGVRARPARARRRDRAALRSGRAAPRGGPGRAGAAGARRRGGARRRRPTTRRRGGVSRRSARASRSSAAAASRRSRRITTASS